MNYCNRRLLLPLEDDGLTVDDIILLPLYYEAASYPFQGIRGLHIQ